MLALVLALALTQPPRLVADPSREVRDRLGGGSQTFTIDSAILGETRRVFVHVPASFAKSAATRRYPTTILFDGEFLMRPVVVVSDLLAEKGQIPESVVVSIDNVDDYSGRVRDLTPPGLAVSGSGRNERGDLFLDFIEKELLPALDAQFRTGPPRTLAGTSSGGILTTYAAATRDTFRFTLALDTPTHLDDKWLVKKLLARARTKPSPPVRYVTMDVRFGWSDEAWKSLTDAAPPSWMLHREKLARESHNSMQFLGSYLGLRELFHDYSMLTMKDAPTASILPAYEKLTATYGAVMTPPAPLLDQVIDDLLMEGRGAAAHAALDMRVAAYGEPRDFSKLRERVAVVEKQPPPTETVEGLLATPFPTVEEARDYLGEWEGEWWINPEDKHRFVLRLVADGARVKGTTATWPEGNVEHEEPLQVLQVTPQGLSFGRMNGMRPRGIVLHEARREGDVLSGAVRFAGINFTWPEGMPKPDHRFVLRKKR